MINRNQLVSLAFLAALAGSVAAEGWDGVIGGPASPAYPAVLFPSMPFCNIVDLDFIPEYISNGRPARLDRCNLLMITGSLPEIQKLRTDLLATQAAKKAEKERDIHADVGFWTDQVIERLQKEADICASILSSPPREARSWREAKIEADSREFFLQSHRSLTETIRLLRQGGATERTAALVKQLNLDLTGSAPELNRAFSIQ